MIEKTILWQRTSSDPFLIPALGSPAAEAVTTPDLLIRGGDVLLYVGAVKDGHERLLVAPFRPEWLAASGLAAWADEARIALDAGPGHFDSLHVFDPAAISTGSRVRLYYSAIGPDRDTLGMAESEDGFTFAKRGTPLFEGRAPDVVYRAGRYHLFYVKALSGRGYAIFSSVSEDGAAFTPVSEHPALDAGEPGAWDGFEVTTPRIFTRRGVFYMLYAGAADPAQKDVPHAFGLARSTDLTHWERYPGNPVFHRGEAGSWDDGAIWFGTVFSWGDFLYLLYEGGTREAIRQGNGPALTQVGLAAVSHESFDRRMAAWGSGGQPTRTDAQ
jgi:hypothetical protein